MPPIFHPPLEEHDKFSTPMNDGEKRIRELLLESLDEGWHVFVQPHLLNQQPDFMLVSAEHGITIVEVKDWQEGGHKCDSPGVLEVRDSRGDWVRTGEDPVLQVYNYKKGIAERFLIPPGANDEEVNNLFNRVKAVVVLPRCPGPRSQVILKKATRLNEKYQRSVKVVGLEVFADARALENLLHGTGRPNQGIEDQFLQRFLNRVSEPEAVADQRRPLKLSAEARRIVNNPDGSIVRRVRGPAGSGKTLALASRAALLAGDGKRVLILTFNITLAHYISDLVGRRSRELGVDRRNVDLIHIHGFCLDIMQDFGTQRDWENANNLDDSADALIHGAEALYRSKDPQLPHYDAIFVDEGQDYKPEWWNFIRHHLRKNDTGELILAADVSQDLYGRRAWTDEEKMKNAGFSGQWAQLQGSYRLPVDYVPIAIDFANHFINGEVDLPSIPSDHDGRAASPTIRNWINAVGVNDEIVGEIVAQEVARLNSLENGPHLADIVVMTETHALGVTIMGEIERSGVRTEHIFTPSDGKDRRRKKKRFYPGVALLKGSTVHSFKGWESRAIIFVLDESNMNGDMGRLSYTAITRVKGDPSQRSAYITIVNRLPAITDYKDKFEREVTSAEVPQLSGAVEFDF
jgi:hypothetical protein